MRYVLLAVSLLAAIGLLAGCSSEDKGGGKVNVTLKEWAIEVSVTSVPKGDVQFEVRNTGPDENHELAIVRTDLAPDKLPTKDDGSVDEKAGGVELVKRIQSFETDRTVGATYTLDPGKYVLIDNLVTDTDGTKVSHYQKGMRAPLTVTDK